MDDQQQQQPPMNRTSIVLALLLVASLGFSIGQATSQPASAGQAARIQPVKDSLAREYLLDVFKAQATTVVEIRELQDITHAVCLNVRELPSTTYACP